MRNIPTPPWTITVFRPHGDGGTRIAARWSSAQGHPEANDESLWSLVGRVQGTMVRKQNAAIHNEQAFFPIQFTPASVAGLKSNRRMDTKSRAQAHTDDGWVARWTFQAALAQARDPERTGSGALLALLLMLERQAYQVAMTHPSGTIPTGSAHMQLAAQHDAQGLLDWDPAKAFVVAQGQT